MSGAGGFGAALELMGNGPRAVWDGMAASMSAFGDRFRAMQADIQALWLRLMRFLGQTWADFLSRIAPGFNQIVDVIGAGFQIDALGVQAWVLDALAHHLMDPEAVAVFCEAYTAERNRLAATATNMRAEIERKLAKVKHDHAKLVDAIIAGVPADQVKDKMIALDDQRQQIEAKLAAAQASPAPLRFHPKMADTYRDRVGILIRGLGREAGLTETREALRGLIEKIVLEPRAEGEGFDIDLHGALAGLLRLATGVEQHEVPGGRKKSANANGAAGAGL